MKLFFWIIGLYHPIVILLATAQLKRPVCPCNTIPCFRNFITLFSRVKLFFWIIGLYHPIIILLATAQLKRPVCPCNTIPCFRNFVVIAIAFAFLNTKRYNIFMTIIVSPFGACSHIVRVIILRTTNISSTAPLVTNPNAV